MFARELKPRLTPRVLSSRQRESIQPWLKLNRDLVEVPQPPFIFMITMMAWSAEISFGNGLKSL